MHRANENMIVLIFSSDVVDIDIFLTVVLRRCTFSAQYKYIATVGTNVGTIFLLRIVLYVQTKSIIFIFYINAASTSN